jgi:hypothetical protein
MYLVSSLVNYRDNFTFSFTYGLFYITVSNSDYITSIGREYMKTRNRLWPDSRYYYSRSFYTNLRLTKLILLERNYSYVNLTCSNLQRMTKHLVLQYAADDDITQRLRHLTQFFFLAEARDCDIFYRRLGFP